MTQKEGKKALGEEAGAGGEGWGRLDTAEPLRAQPGRGHAPVSLQQPSRPENIKPEKRKKRGRRGRPMPGGRCGYGAGEGGRGGTWREGRKSGAKEKNKLRV